MSSSICRRMIFPSENRQDQHERRLDRLSVALDPCNEFAEDDRTAIIRHDVLDLEFDVFD